MISRRIGTAFSILLLVASTALAQENHGDFVGTGVEFLQVTEETQTAGDPAVLWDAPTLTSSTALSFTPPGYVSSCAAGGSDVTSSLLTMDLSAQSGSTIAAIAFGEGGSVSLNSFPPFGTPATNASASLSGTATVTETTSGPIAPVVIPFTGTFISTEIFALPGDFGLNSWTGSVTIDVAAQVPLATEVTLAIDNTLDTNCAPGNTSSLIEKVSVSGPVVTLAPVPCATGSISATGFEPCTLCPPGFFQDQEGQQACLPCPADTFTNVSGSTSCEACPAGETAPPGSVMCTPLAVPLNHFQCYDVARIKFDRFPVDLTDDFGPSVTEVRRPRLLCAPVNKNSEDPTAPGDPDHLIGYQTRRTSARFERVVEELVTDQFGSLVLDLQRPERLLVPSAKDLSGPATPLDPAVVDHYQCYKVRGDRRRVQNVEVEDQFTDNGPDVTDVKKPLRLCLPVDKNGEGILDNAARLMCYQTKPGPRVNREAWFYNQFGGGVLEVRRARELCVPVATPAPAITPTATVSVTPTVTPTSTATLTPTPTPTATPACQTNGDCDDGVFCNGVETCFNGECFPEIGGACPIPVGVCIVNRICNEAENSCTDVPAIDGTPCFAFPGGECSGGTCQPQTGGCVDVCDAACRTDAQNNCGCDPCGGGCTGFELDCAIDTCTAGIEDVCDPF